MLPIGGIYEVAIKVKELSPAEGFYQEILGLEVGIRNLRRNWLFLRAGGDAGMIVLQEEKGEFPPQLFAFTIPRPTSSAQPKAFADGVLMSNARSFTLGFRRNRSILTILAETLWTFALR